MLWKVLGVIVLAWLAIGLISAIVKSVIPLVILGLIILGAVTLYRKANANEPSRF
jgi:hypothetical protein